MDSPILSVDGSPRLSAVGDARHLRHALPLPAAADIAQRQLWWRLATRYPVQQQQVSLGQEQLTIACIPDQEWAWRQMAQAASSHKEADPAYQPYWIVAWESSQALAAHLHALPLTNSQVLDLGCGVGLVGTRAAMLGARVTMVDAVPHALLFARWNSWVWRSRVCCRRLDWRRERLGYQFDWIFGADIIYNQEDWPYLHVFWQEHLRNHGKVLLAEPSRSISDGFPQWAEQVGWQVSIPAPVQQVADRRIRFFQLTRNATSSG